MSEIDRTAPSSSLPVGLTREHRVADAPRAAPFDSPYVGLTPYSEKQAPLFFGRETDCEVIVANLRASRLTLLYGPSGVGKSSVLRAGVAHRLRQRAQASGAPEAVPDFVVVYFKEWVNDPLAELAACVEEEIKSALPRGLFEPVPRSRDLAEMLAAWTERFGLELLIILDQFEEYFLYRPTESGVGTFADEFPKAVNQRDLPVRFLLSLREDALSRLDRFKGSIPHLFDTRLQIAHLREQDARAAIKEPVRVYNELSRPHRPAGSPDYDIEPGLVDEVLRQVGGLKRKLSGVGQGTLKDDQTQAEIEAPYLQLVMTRIWKTEQEAKSPLLRLATFTTQLGGADKIVREHLDAVMSGLPTKQQEVAASVFPYLVTPVGTKITHAVKSLADPEYANVSVESLKPVLQALTEEGRRILRKVPIQTSQGEEEGYEIFHDALAPAILDWRSRYEVRRTQRRTYRFSGAIGLLLFLLIIPFYISARRAAAVAEEQKRQAIIEAAREAEEAQRKTEDAQRDNAELRDKESQIKQEAEKLEQILSGAPNRQPQELRTSVARILEQTKENPPPAPRNYDQLPARVYIQILSETQRARAREAQRHLERAGFVVPGIENVGPRRLRATELRYFRAEDQAKTAAAVTALKAAGLDNVAVKYIRGSEGSTKIRPKHYELWFASDASGDESYAPVQQAPPKN